MQLFGVNKRFDIQALRAVAVIAVLLFHSGFLLSAGYLGVDVFFVVSGFVVTQVILRRIHSEGSLDLWAFWGKRVRRLFPGLALMVVVVTPMSLLVFPRLEEASAGLITAAAGMFSAANVASAILEFDYFAAPSKENFMLHLWSLSIEEQFYIFWPLAFAAVWGGFKIRKFRIIATLVALVSLGVWVIGSTELLGYFDRGQTLFSFFSPIARSWEFIAGALVALVPQANKSTRSFNLLSYGGWIVMLAILIFAPNEQPGQGLSVVALVLSVGAILRWGGGNIERILRGKNYSWIQFIGDRSYSLYLWHWPLAVFVSVLLPEQKFAALLGVLISVPLSFLAFTLVEQPFRSTTGIGRQKLKTSVPAFLLCTSVVLGSTVISFGPVEKVVSQEALVGDLGGEEILKEMRRISVGCSFPISCFQSLPGNEVDILILGNSHGAHLSVGLVQIFASKNVVWVGNSSLIDGKVSIPEILDEIPSPETIIVSEYLSAQGQENRVIEWESALELLTESGATVVVTNGSPTLDIPAYKCKYGVVWDPQQHRCSFLSEPNNLRHAIYSTGLKTAATKFETVKIADVYSVFCDSQYCRVGDSDGLFFRDLNHFTALGSSMAAEAIKKAIED
ncbi:acyltransferase [bacterium]|nr:acyltransferase [bacterium]